MPKFTSKSKAAIFANSLDDAPTPWISAGWTDEYGSGFEVKFRLWVRRRGHGLFVEMHESSKLAPGHVRAVHRSQTGLFELRRAAMALLAMAKWDPNRPPSHPRAVWNTLARDWLHAKDYVRTVSMLLPQVMLPKRGRPRLYTQQRQPNPDMPIGLRGNGPVSSRRARRSEMLVMTERITQLTLPLQEQLQDARRMRGYTAQEQERIRRMVVDILQAVRLLHAGVFFDALHLPDSEILRAAEPAPDKPHPHPADVERATQDLTGFTLELVDVPAATDMAEAP